MHPWLKKATNIVTLMGFLVSVAMAMGAYNAYIESKFATKDAMAFEIDQRKTDYQILREDIKGIDSKIDKVLHRMSE